MTDRPRRPGPESTLDEVREHLIETASGLLVERGVDLRLTPASLRDVIAAAGVSRATAYRSLAEDQLEPQAVLDRAVLTRLLSRDTRAANHEVVSSVVADELERQADNLESDDIERRTHAVRSLIRVGAEASYEAVAASTERSILTAAYGSLRSTGASDWRLAALRIGESQLADLFGQLYKTLSAMVGYELRPEFTIEQFATAAAGCVEGIAMRHGVSEVLDGVTRPSGLGGVDEDWSLYGVAFEGMFAVFFRTVDPSDPFADLTAH